MKTESPRLPIRLGCPVFSCANWAGSVYPQCTPQREFLRHYSRMFNTVEGNSSFYAIPTPEQTKRWCDISADGFAFCMKFPREVSHERQLVAAESATRRFLDAIEVLADAGRLGSTFLQLGPDFSPRQFSTLEKFLDSLPTNFPWAVEPRHMDWYDQGENEAAINALLSDRRIDKVLFDSRALFSREPEDEAERKSQQRKPKTPVRQTVTGTRPMLRLIGRNNVEQAVPQIRQWAKIVARWLSEGLEPTIFTHTPDDTFAPEMARLFYHELACALKPDSPEEALPTLPAPPRKLKQLDLL